MGIKGYIYTPKRYIYTIQRYNYTLKGIKIVGCPGLKIVVSREYGGVENQPQPQGCTKYKAIFQRAYPIMFRVLCKVREGGIACQIKKT